MCSSLLVNRRLHKKKEKRNQFSSCLSSSLFHDYQSTVIIVNCIDRIPFSSNLKTRIAGWVRYRSLLVVRARYTSAIFFLSTCTVSRTFQISDLARLLRRLCPKSTLAENRPEAKGRFRVLNNDLSLSLFLHHLLSCASIQKKMDKREEKTHTWTSRWSGGN